jgi:hypothetical protein
MKPRVEMGIDPDRHHLPSSRVLHFEEAISIALKCQLSFPTMIHAGVNSHD